MKLRLIVSLLVILLTLDFACKPSSPPSNRAIIIQPFSEFSHARAVMIYDSLKKINPNTTLVKTIPLPSSAFYAPRNRYRADSLINYLSRLGNAGTVIIGLTEKDISTTKGNITDWGIMGLGFQPGNACVISTFRLSKARSTDQFYKLALHELGHTEGLPHCSNKTCLMRDAEGSNHLDEERGFCESCKSFLKSKGWLLK
jgi:archaemetzincin